MINYMISSRWMCYPHHNHHTILLYTKQIKTSNYYVRDKNILYSVGINIYIIGVYLHCFHHPTKLIPTNTKRIKGLLRC